MAADDTDTQTAAPPPSAPASPDMIAQAMQLAQRLAPQPIQPDTTPAQGGIVGLLGRIGSALAGGSVTDVMSPAQRERAGLRALGDFGTSLMAGSGYYPGKPMFGGLAQGFEGATRSEAGSEQQVAAQLGAQQDYQTKQAALRLQALKEAVPLLRLEQAGSIPNVLASGPAVPGTAGGAGTPGGGGGLSALAYGQGGPGSTIPVPDEYMPMFEAAAKRNNIPVDLLIAQARQESGFNPNAAGGGIFQIQDKTALKPGFGMQGVQNPAILKDAKTNIDFGADYLAARAKAAGVDLNTPQGQVVGLQAYNGGGDKDYVQHVTRYMPAPLAPVQTAGPGAPTGGPTTPPAATPPGTGQTPPAGSTAQLPPASTDTTAATPAAPPAFADFQAKNPIPTTPEEQATLDGLKRVQQQTAIELQNAPLTGVDRVKAVQAAREAADNLANATRQIQDAHTAHQVTLFTSGNTLAQQAKDKAAELAQAAQLKQQEQAQTVAENEKNRQAEIEKAKLASGYSIQQEQAKADMDIAKTDLNDRAADAQKAGRVIPILQQMQGQIGKMPDGFIGGLLAKYDTTGDMTGILAKMGVVDPSKATAAQMLIAARNYLSIEMKPAATGSLRVAEMDKLQSFTPGQLQTPEAQNEMAARLIAYQKRIQDERSFASTYFGRPSDPNNPNSPRIYDNRNLDKAMNAPVKYDQNGNVTGGGLGPVVPEPPSANAPDAEHQAYLNYVNRNLAPGAPYQVWEPKRNQDGSLALDANRRPIPQRVTKLKVYQ